jgi:hypothetical protein
MQDLNSDQKPVPLILSILPIPVIFYVFSIKKQFYRPFAALSRDAKLEKRENLEIWGLNKKNRPLYFSILLILCALCVFAVNKAFTARSLCSSRLGFSSAILASLRWKQGSVPKVLVSNPVHPANPYNMALRFTLQ